MQVTKIPSRTGRLACVIVTLCGMTACASGAIDAPNPTPSISSLSPSSVTAGSAAQTLTINGSGFISSSAVIFSGMSRPTTFVNAGQLTFQVTAADQATAGTVGLAVVNPAPGGGSSSTVTLTVDNSAPTITSFSPASTTAGQDSVMLTINGSGFIQNSAVAVNGIPRLATLVTLVSATQLTTKLNYNDLRTAGTVPITVTNPTPGGGTASANYTIVDACTALATNLPYQPNSLGFALYQPVLDQSSVYWVDVSNNQSAIKKVSKTGGSVTVLASGLGAVNQIAVDGTNVYWTEYAIGNGNGAIKSVPKTGGSVTVLATGTPAGSTFDVFFPVGITLDATYAYWGEGVGGGAIRRVPKTGGQVVDIGRGQGAVSFLTIDSTQTYFYFVGDSSSFFRLPFAGGARQLLAAKVGTNIGGGWALDANFLYGVDLVDQGSVFKVPTGGGSPTYLVTNLRDPHNLAIDANYIYYPLQGNPVHSIAKLPKAGGTGTSTTLPGCGAQVAGVIAVAVDEAYVYAVGFNSANAAVVFKQVK